MTSAADLSISVLLIESDEAACDVFRRNMRRIYPGVELRVAGTVAEAMRVLRETGYDIIVCDALLARDEKMHFATTMCVERPGTPLVVLTSDTDLNKEDFRPAIKGTCIWEVLHKPLDLQDFVNTMRNVIEAVKESRTGGGGGEQGYC